MAAALLLATALGDSITAGSPGSEIRRLNELVAAIAVEEAISLLPFHHTLEDPDRPGRMRPGWTSEGDPSVEGYRRLGELAFTLP